MDGAEVKTGSASLTVTPCGGGTGLELPLTTGGGRWNASLDTSLLVGSCHTVTAWVQGLEAGSFRLELRGAEPAKASKTPAPTATSGPTPASTSDTKPDQGQGTKERRARHGEARQGQGPEAGQGREEVTAPPRDLS